MTTNLRATPEDRSFNAAAIGGGDSVQKTRMQRDSLVVAQRSAWHELHEGDSVRFQTKGVLGTMKGTI